MVAIKKKFLSVTGSNIDISLWLEKVREVYHLNSIDIIEKACYFTEQNSQFLTADRRKSLLEKSLEMAEITLDLQLDQEAIATSILISLIQNTSIPLEVISHHFGDNVTKLINNVTKMDTINYIIQAKSNRGHLQIDRLRKTLLAMAADIRAVVIKLAERTSMMRNIKHIEPAKRHFIAQETMDLYAPLANRLGIGQLKWELEDIAFHYINPEAYKTIATLLSETRADREKRIVETIALLTEKLDNVGLKAEIFGRAKHIYSIYLKMQKKQLDYKDIYDSSAVRILVADITDCYNTLSIIHTLFDGIPNEFDDYIAHPKQNGYRSIHLAVIGPDGKNLEIQIRTHAMHLEAENGVAAHWIYKEQKSPTSAYEAKITFLRQLLAWQKDLTHSDNMLASIDQQKGDDRVYVFTPAADILDLPIGATPLDFAYMVHSSIGHRCRGAKVNGRIVPLTYTLKTTDQVEIMTSPHGTPSRDWLNKESGYLKTSFASSKVRHWFRQQEQLLQPIEPHKTSVERDSVRAPLSRASSLPDIKNSSLALNATEPLLKHKIGGTADLLTRLAKCCNPTPEKDIIGFITRGRGISIHLKQCHNISHYMSHLTHRFIDVFWEKNKA